MSDHPNPVHPAGVDPALVTAVLHGGPASLTAEQRRRLVTPEQRKIKIPWLGGYEHFERDLVTGVDHGAAVVFQWTARTRVAE